MKFSIYNRKVKCYRCGMEVQASSAHLINGRFFSHGCYEKIREIQNLKTRRAYKEHSVKTCSHCGSRYIASEETEKVCGISSEQGRCCFCCEFSTSLKYRSQNCPLESYIKFSENN